MDELDVLKQMRSNLPGPQPEAKERLWLRLQEESSSKRPNTTRNVRGFLAGLFLLAVLAVSPVGTAVADRVSELLGGDDYSQSRQLAPQIDEAIQAIRPSNDPSLTPAERFELGNQKIQAAVRGVQEEAGVSPEPALPPGVVTRLKASPLNGLNLDEYRAFCAKVAKLAPNDHSCELNFMVQNGEIRPGNYTQAQIDEIFEEKAPKEP